MQAVFLQTPLSFEWVIKRFISFFSFRADSAPNTNISLAEKYQPMTAIYHQ